MPRIDLFTQRKRQSLGWFQCRVRTEFVLKWKLQEDWNQTSVLWLQPGEQLSQLQQRGLWDVGAVSSSSCWMLWKTTDAQQHTLETWLSVVQQLNTYVGFNLLKPGLLVFQFFQVLEHHRTHCTTGAAPRFGASAVVMGPSHVAWKHHWSLDLMHHRTRWARCTTEVMHVSKVSPSRIF